MKTIQLASSLIALGLTLGVPNVAIAHVGHGDEFQAEGGINRVGVNAETDSVLGIVVEPIQSAPDGNAGVYIPATALVDGGDKQLVFVQYGEFYEPVPVATGSTQGELIEVTNGLSVGEKLVTQGSLSLYAESRKTQPTETAETAPAPAPIVSPDPSHAQADAEGIPHQHDTAGNMASGTDGVETSQAGGNPLVGIVGGIVGLLVGSTVFIFSLRAFNLSKKKSRISRKKEAPEAQPSYRE
ncbi:cobalt transporter [Synechocystis sp. FACHB-383]|uniref:efflux RND transporter periplasmic adaptor subunit n=1 Tax=Synechocystis sp. FACHB-383 TaxID=2692864 RepID=UPI00168274E4|nr:efflux RND transporter periplasmic adaptor subunit [Synechocystis sp. FACHB-383]MBD2651985.1 cobalt transporter [Synechocystis sp. FACHB-383]